MTEEPTATTEPEKAPEKLDFKFKKVKTKPKRAFRKGSKYDPIIDAFQEGKETLAEILVKKKDGKTYVDGNYLRNQLNKRIEALEIKNIETSVVNDVCYLEKITPE